MRIVGMDAPIPLLCVDEMNSKNLDPKIETKNEMLTPN